MPGTWPDPAPRLPRRGHLHLSKPPLAPYDHRWSLSRRPPSPPTFLAAPSPPVRCPLHVVHRFEWSFWNSYCESQQQIDLNEAIELENPFEWSNWTLKYVWIDLNEATGYGQFKKCMMRCKHHFYMIMFIQSKSLLVEHVYVSVNCSCMKECIEIAAKMVLHISLFIRCWQLAVKLGVVWIIESYFFDIRCKTDIPVVWTIETIQMILFHFHCYI
jgi:hypothetical protein